MKTMSSKYLYLSIFIVIAHSQTILFHDPMTNDSRLSISGSVTFNQSDECSDGGICAKISGLGPGSSSLIRTKYGAINTIGHTDITLSWKMEVTNFPFISYLYVQGFSINKTYDIAVYDNDAITQNTHIVLEDVPLNSSWADNNEHLQIQFVVTGSDENTFPVLYVDDIQIRGTLTPTTDPTTMPTPVPSAPTISVDYAPTSQSEAAGDYNQQTTDISYGESESDFTSILSNVNFIILIAVCSALLLIGVVLCGVGACIYRRKRREQIERQVSNVVQSKKKRVRMSPVLQIDVDTESRGQDSPQPGHDGNTPSPGTHTPLTAEGGVSSNGVSSNGIRAVDYNTLGVGSLACSTYVDSTYSKITAIGPSRTASQIRMSEDVDSIEVVMRDDQEVVSPEDSAYTTTRGDEVSCDF